MQQPVIDTPRRGRGRPPKTPLKEQQQLVAGHMTSATSSPATPATATALGSATPHYKFRARKDSPHGHDSPCKTHSRRSKRAFALGLDPTTQNSPSKISSKSSSKPRLLHDDSSSRRLLTMASTAGKWREEQILVICPGSRTTMAQLGCTELTPPTHRMPTRMFRDGDQWAPHHKERRIRVVNGVEEEEWVEDVDEEEGAVWPVEGGRIVNMDALLAFFDYVHGLLTTTYHNTPIMLMASPQWTRPDCETIARYIFENTRTPALCIIHSGVATQYGLKWPNLTVVDIGYEKVDVTAIHDGRVVNHIDLGAPAKERQISGGEVFTRNLRRLLDGKGFNHDMAEQLKKSSICEVLPYAAAAKDLVELPVENTAGIPPTAVEPDDEVEPAIAALAEAEGVLDVAAIVTSGQTKEFLAKKEKEKGKPGRKPKGDKEEPASKPARLPNAKRTHNVFFYEEVVMEDVPPAPKEIKENGTAETAATGDNTPAADGAVATEAPKPVDGTTAETSTSTSTVTATEPPERRPKRVRRDIERHLPHHPGHRRHVHAPRLLG
ncbi:hypothetical protein G7046_g9525 [Stylonectria norvegica]|nr:hypothetical protein G7046_g9525 [Stylonectria norvegica]